MATTEIGNGCGLSTEAVLASNHKRRRVKKPALENLLEIRCLDLDYNLNLPKLSGVTITASRPAEKMQSLGQPFTYDLFDSLRLAGFGPRGPWFVEWSGTAIRDRSNIASVQ